MSNHVMYDRGGWFLRCNHVKFVRFMLFAVSEEAKTWIPFFFLQMYNKTIIRFGFCDIQNNQGLGKDYQPQSYP